MEKVSVQRALVLFSFFVAGLSSPPLFSARPALAALTPESPQVREMIDRGTKWLETAQDNRLGARALVGLVLVKNGAPPDHPKVVEAVKAIQQLVQGATEPKRVIDRFADERIIYSISLAAIFLVTLDAPTYRSEIEMLVSVFEALQKEHGGWGYPAKSTGDTSMTQNVVLALWEAHQAGITVRMEMVEKVADWLLRTQDPSGGFGYQGEVAASTTALVSQTPVPADWQKQISSAAGLSTVTKPLQQSMSAAGLSSVYVCSDLLGLVRAKQTLPTGMKEVLRDDQRVVSRIGLHQMEAAKSRGGEWLRANHDLEAFSLHYYLYSLERYWSFQEDLEGKVPAMSRLYDEIAVHLRKSQQSDGSWIGVWGTPPTRGSVPDTCFSLLFLLRSARKSIEKARGYGAGLLVGGRGLPKGTAAIELRGSQAVARPLTGPGQPLMTALADTDSPDFERALESLANLRMDEARQLVSPHEAKLRAMVADSDADARLAAVQALGNSDDLDNAPTLIYALGDPDPDVVLAARDGLQRISRRFDTLGPPDEHTENQRLEAIRRWKDWYLAIRPDAEFEN